MVRMMPEKSEMKIGGVANPKKDIDYRNHGITGIGKNTEKGVGDLRRLAVTHSSVMTGRHLL